VAEQRQAEREDRMTVVECPHGCGGTVDTAKSGWCSSCRMHINTQVITIDEDLPLVIEDNTIKYKGAKYWERHRKASWCWEWHGPPVHRMRCRLPKGHAGEHDCDDAEHVELIRSNAKEVRR
jgi:hypothetical protein